MIVSEFLELTDHEDLNLNDLLVSQNNVRHNSEHLCEMIKFVNNGGYFTQWAMNDWIAKNHNERTDPPLIGITLFPDGVKLLHDGHNRSIAIKLGGRDFVHPSEYFIKKYDYEHYTILEPHNGWFTPFDPKTELRHAEFIAYKIEAKTIHENNPGILTDWVDQNRDGYCLPRDIFSVNELIDRIKPRLNNCF